MRNKKAAMEMSMGTMVTIILLVVILVLGIFFIQKIFSSGSNAIDLVDNQVQSEINKLFASDEGLSVSVYPNSREITIKKGSNPKGFAFSVRNDEVNTKSFSYKVGSQDVSKCGTSLTKAQADDYLLGKQGSFSLGGGNTLDMPILVKLNIPKSAPPCTIIYQLEVKKGDAPYSNPNIFVTIK
jgi:hypothetical protein